MLRTKLSKLIFGFAVVVIAGVIVAAIALTSNSDTSNNSGKTTSATIKSDKPKSDVEVLSPTVIVKKISKYKDKTVAIKGFIYDFGAAGYFIAGEEQKPGVVPLDFSKTKLNAKDYVSVRPENQQLKPGEKPTLKGPYIVTGKFIQPAKNGAPVLIVATISKD